MSCCSEKSSGPWQDAHNLCVLDRELGVVELRRVGTSIVLLSKSFTEIRVSSHCQLVTVGFTRLGHCCGATRATPRW
jgi:hypothetical protein